MVGGGSGGGGMVGVRENGQKWSLISRRWLSKWLSTCLECREWVCGRLFPLVCSSKPEFEGNNGRPSKALTT